MFTFVESVAVAVTAAVKARRGAGATSFTVDPFVNGPRPGGAARIALRRYRFFSRESNVDVDRTGATLVIPRVFGGGRAWFIPIEAIGVVLPEPNTGVHAGQCLADDEDWVTRDEFRTPYLRTTSPFADPNLTLLFTVPQRIPPIRWFIGRDLDISPLATRKAVGLMVDGVELRVEDPDFARRALVANGAHSIADPDSFVQRHRDVISDPAHIRAAAAHARWSLLLMVSSGVATVALFVGFKVTDDARYGIGMVAVLAVGALLERMTERRRGH
jgi:hypothetical protein